MSDSADHDAWFRAEVMRAMADPDRVFFSEDEVAAELLAYAEALESGGADRPPPATNKRSDGHA